MSATVAGPEFRGSFTGLARQMAAAVLPVAAAISFLLFGARGGRMFLVSLLVLPVLFVLAWAISRVDRIRFDDAGKALHRNLRPPISYSRIERVRFVESMGVTQATLQHGKRTELLAVGLAGDDAEELSRALRSRNPGIEVENKDYAAWKLTAVAVGLLIAVSVAGTYYLESKTPSVAAACVSAAPAALTSNLDDPLVSRGEGLAVTLPRELEGKKFTVLRTGAFRETGQVGRLFLATAGIGSEWELFQYAACSRYGVVPRMLKAVLLSRWESPRIYTAESDSTRALLVAGNREGEVEARILLNNQAAGLDAMVAVLLDDELTVPMIAALLHRFSVEGQ